MYESHCAICLESITDPVCIYCYIKQVKTWFRDINVNPLVGKFAVNKIKDKLLVGGISEINCILCGSENVDICFYCFGFMTVQILRELNLPDSMIESFSESFNYDLMGRDLDTLESHHNYEIQNKHKEVKNE
jgi:hypothetical protein